MRSLFRGIGWRIFLSFSTLLIILTLILGFVALKFAQRAATDNAENELRVVSVTISEQVQRYVKRVESSLKSLSATHGFLDKEIEGLSPRRSKIEQFLDVKLSTSMLFEDLSVFDVNGTCLASTQREWEGLSALHENFFVNGIKKSAFDEQEREIFVGIPINEGPDPHGVLAARLKLPILYELMGQQLGFEGRAYLLNSKLRLITERPEGDGQAFEDHLDETPLVNHKQEEFWVGRYINFEGDEVLGTIVKLPVNNWYIVIERQYAAVGRQLDRVKGTLFEAALVLLVVLILVTILISHSITRPLQALVEGARRIAAGDFSRAIAVPTGVDEISFLAAEFDRMRARIQASQGRLIEQLAESEKRRLESERLAAIGTLASSMAHEIRNPLNAMSLFIAQLERSGSDPQRNGQALRSMKEEINRLDRLVSDMLDYARPLQLQTQLVNLKDFFSELLTFYRPSFEADRIQPSWEGPELSMWLDPNRFRQAIVNLIQNAVDAMAAVNDTSRRLKLTWQPSDSVGADAVKIILEDSGPGIPNDLRGRVFDLFFTTKEQGTGLGLSNVRKIVEAHGGTIEIERLYPTGTRVVLELPFSQK